MKRTLGSFEANSIDLPSLETFTSRGYSFQFIQSVELIGTHWNRVR